MVKRRANWLTTLNVVLMHKQLLRLREVVVAVSSGRWPRHWWINHWMQLSVSTLTLHTWLVADADCVVIERLQCMTCWFQCWVSGQWFYSLRIFIDWFSTGTFTCTWITIWRMGQLVQKHMVPKGAFYSTVNLKTVFNIVLWDFILIWCWL